jgi:hypothetical protein
VAVVMYRIICQKFCENLYTQSLPASLEATGRLSCDVG